MNRRECLKGALAVIALPATARAAQSGFAPVVPGRVLRFPEDEGSHPGFRTEWWYVTGWLDGAGEPLGFQVTFFRARPHPASGNPSRFDPRDILILHAAVSERAHGRLRHVQRGARAGFGLAEAATGRTAVHIDDWYLRTNAAGYATRIDAGDFTLDLQLDPTQPPLLQGDGGYSRKGPRPESASYYYSLPHLRVGGQVRIEGRTRDVLGSAWFDHEWSSEYMAPQAVGWDWTGINLDDGSALMAFRMRTRDGRTFWAAATLKRAQQRRTFAPDEVVWSPKRTWRSPRTGATYPVAMELRVGDLRVELVPMMDDQENDARITTGAVYWEGAVTALVHGQPAGRGYMELTGYAGKLEL
ncbi:MAG: carotenoid 1,2-hydratase [Betaproteobacteria bacterium]|nr:carotenoid 1,2-hydratase [Betaproteobacteria bacterium]